ncbi:MAG: hypothetical protein Q7R39_00210 [Dehalococcoidia bacterium]|nr:hypothetical protein [Dehalococcoidia bacterium]
MDDLQRSKDAWASGKSYEFVDLDEVARWTCGVRLAIVVRVIAARSGTNRAQGG